MIASRLLNGNFTISFALAVNGQRSSFISFKIRRRLQAIKDKVRGEVNQNSLGGLGVGRKRCWDQVIDTVGEILMCLGLIDRRVGGGILNDTGLQTL